MEDMKQKIVNIIKDASFYKKSSNNDVYFCPNIDEKVIKKLKKHISADINVNSIAVVIDSTFLNSGKEGSVFTTTGVYFKQMFIKKNYFNYADVEYIDFDVYLRVHLKNSDIIEISTVEYDQDGLTKALYKLNSLAIQQGITSKRKSGNLKKIKMSDELANKCHVVIHSAAISAGVVGTGLAQIPLSDSVLISGIQVSMIIALGKVFDMNISEGVAKGILAGASGKIVGRGFVQVAVGWLPGLGNVINTATASGLTEAIGWTAANQFYQESLDNIAKYTIEGEKRGYIAASEEYESKLRKQAEQFLKQKMIYESQYKKLSQLLDEYEKYIEKLEEEQDNNLEIKNKIVIMTDELKQLKRLKVV